MCINLYADGLHLLRENCVRSLTSGKQAVDKKLLCFRVQGMPPSLTLSPWMPYH